MRFFSRQFLHSRYSRRECAAVHVCRSIPASVSPRRSLVLLPLLLFLLVIVLNLLLVVVVLGASLSRLALLEDVLVADEFERLGQRHLPYPALLVRVLHPLDDPRHLDELGPERGAHELRPGVRLRAHHRGDGCAVLRIERGVNLVEEVKRHRVAALDGEDECDRDDGFLAAGELLHLHRLALPEGHLDLDAAVLLRESFRDGGFGRFSVGIGVFGVGRGRGGLLALHHELALAAVDEPGEHLAEVKGHLLERALDGLVLLLVEERHQLLDLRVRLVELAAANLQALALLRELLVLVQRLFVDVRQLGELLVGLGEHRVKRLERLAAVLFKRVAGERPEVANLPL